jgi:hypothetical protein
LFPSLAFRLAYDRLQGQHSVQKAAKEYLKILQLAAGEGESLVEQALESLAELGGAVRFSEVQMIVESWKATPRPATQLRVEPVDLRRYDGLLAHKVAM